MESDSSTQAISPDSPPKAGSAFLTAFHRQWKKLPIREWDCQPKEWESALWDIENTLSLIETVSGPERLRREVPSAAAIWFESFFDTVRGGVTSASMDAVVELFRPKRLAAIATLDTGIGRNDIRLFLRAGAELGSRKALKYFLANLAHLQRTSSVSQRHALIEHLLECHRFAGQTSPLDLPAHIVFHEVVEARDDLERRHLERFMALTATPVPMMGRLDTAALERTLRVDAPWLGSAIDVLTRRVEASLLGWSGLRLAPLLLVGPPGAGKSWLAQRLGDLLDLPTLVISAAGSGDNMALKGTARGWSSARPGLLVDFIARHQVANPLVVVDEIDKSSPNSRNGNLLGTLHQMLEQENARQWLDEYLLGRCDLSRVSWIATANSIAQLPATLLSRFQVINVAAPGPAHRSVMLHSVMRQIAREQTLGFELAAWLEDSEWRLLEHNATSPRQARRMIDALLGYKTRELRQRPH